jgi:glycosyltransferase involved in cell wall biosynthesis
MGGLRFCFLTTFYPPYNFGGDGIAVQRLARALVRRGHHVTVVHDADAFRLLAGREPREPPASDGVEVISLHSGWGALGTLLTQQTGRPIVNGHRIARILEEGAFDVIHFHNASLIGGPGLFRYGRSIKLYTAHEHWLVCPTHILWRHNREPCSARQCLRCQLVYRRPPQWWRWTGLLDRELHHIDTFIALSEFSRRKHYEFGFPRPMEVLPPFLPDDDSQSATAAENPHPRPYFLFVGRLEKAKGLEDVIPVFGTRENADLLVAGEGSFAQQLRRLAARNDRVVFLGHVASDTLRRYYRHAIALVVPSSCFETFGLAIVEAFRDSCPVIARRIGPFTELVELSTGGELFSTPEELRAAIRRLSDDRDYRDRLGSAGRQAFSRHWSECAVLPRYLELVQQAAERRGQRQLLERLDPSGGAA